MSDTASSTPVGALALLPLPRMLHLLTEQQLRGAECVWCYETVDPATAFVFDTQTGTIRGVDSHWFPRACPACVGKQVRKALHAHAGICEQCVDDTDLCDEQQALRELGMESQR